MRMGLSEFVSRVGSGTQITEVSQLIGLQI